MNNKIFCGNGKTRTSQYGEFYTIGVKLEELEKYVNNGYVNLVINKRKDPDKFGNDLSVCINNYKPKEDKPTDDISVEDLPFS